MHVYQISFTHIYICVCIYVCAYIYEYVFVCVCVCVFMCVYIYMYMCACVCINKYVCIYVYITRQAAMSKRAPSGAPTTGWRSNTYTNKQHVTQMHESNYKQNAV